MTRIEEWTEFLVNMLTCNLAREEKELVDEVLLELDADAKRKNELSYQQGIRDGVWILKQLGVLA